MKSGSESLFKRKLRQKSLYFDVESMAYFKTELALHFGFLPAQIRNLFLSAEIYLWNIKYHTKPGKNWVKVRSHWALAMVLASAIALELVDMTNVLWIS